MDCLGSFYEKEVVFCQRVISEEKHLFELKLSRCNKDYVIYYWEIFIQKFFALVFDNTLW
jgi:hypothetical protein